MSLSFQQKQESPNPLSSINDEQIKTSTNVFDRFEQILSEKQKNIEVQRQNIQRSIEQTFQQTFEQLIEIRRFCRNDIEQQTLNLQVEFRCQIELQRMLDTVQYLKMQNLLISENLSDSFRSCSDELENYRVRLSNMKLIMPQDLDSLLSNMSKSFSSIIHRPLSEVVEFPVETVEKHEAKSNELSPAISSESETTQNDSELSQSSNATIKELNRFKFGPTIRLVYPCDLIASNGRSILSYAIEKGFLNYSTVTGSNLSSTKLYRLFGPVSVHHIRLWDLIWCHWSQFYVIATSTGLYSVRYPYDSNSNTTDQTPQLTKLVGFRNLSFQHVRIAAHSMGWYVYTIEHQNVAIDLYDRRSGERLRHIDNHSHHDALPLGFHGFCLNEKFLAIVKKTEVLSTINNPHQIQNEKSVQVFFFDLQTMNSIQKMYLRNCSNVEDIKCCSEKNIFAILAEPIQLILVNLDTDELLRKKLVDDGKHLCVVNDQELFILRSQRSIQTLQYRTLR